VPALLGVLVYYQTGLFRSATGATFDEPVYIELGVESWRNGSFPETTLFMPPALPLVLTQWLPALYAGPTPLSPGEVLEVLPLARRAHVLLVGIPLVLLVYTWLMRRRGWPVAALGGALMAFSPTILAHSSIAATDACFALFALLALASLGWYWKAPSVGRFILAGIAVGLALASKQSAVFLFPLALVGLLCLAIPRNAVGQRWKDWFGLVLQVAGRMTGFTLIAFASSWACYGFASRWLLQPGEGHPFVQALLGDGVWASALARLAEGLRVPVSFTAVMSQFAHGMKGTPAFLCGFRSEHGWWYYFPTTFALKSTWAELILAATTVVALFWRSTWRDPTLRLWLSALGVFGVLSMLSTLNLGHRYIILVYPLVVLVSVDRCAAWLGRRCWWLPATAVALLAIQGVSAWGIAPHYLGYFNELAGGPNEGYHYLVDSNVDWGQDLPLLRAELERLGSRRPLLAYFGSDCPAAHGIHALCWREADDVSVMGCDCVAISVTYLQGVYLNDDPLAPFRKLRPAARVGYSILLYDPREQDVQTALVYMVDRLRQRPELARND
jgi:hypothetical protein